MSLGRLMSVLSAVVLAGGVAHAQPTPAPTDSDTAPPEGTAAEGSAVQPIEDEPPPDMEGVDENPDAPRGLGQQPEEAAPKAPTQTRAGYPIEEALRPITLPQNMSEISISPHFQVKPFRGSDALRARYGITPKVQLGLTYVYGGVFDDPSTFEDKVGFHPGKAVGLDVTVLLTNWVGVRVGVPVYLDPFAMSFAAGAPMKFIFDKWAIGGLDDLLNITLPLGAEFPPSFYQEQFNAQAAENDVTGSQQSRGFIRIAGYGIYQHKPNLAIIGRFGIETDLGAGGGRGAGSSANSTSTTYLRAGLQFSPKRFLDLGASLGFDDLSAAGSFGVTGFLAVRI